MGGFCLISWLQYMRGMVGKGGWRWRDEGGWRDTRPSLQEKSVTQQTLYERVRENKVEKDVVTDNGDKKKRGSRGDGERMKKMEERVTQASFSLQITEAQDSCGFCYRCVMCLIAGYYGDATPPSSFPASQNLFLVLRPTVYSFIYFFSTFSLPFLFCCRRAGSRILIWCYDLLLIGHLCFFHLSFPTNGTHFHTPCSLRPLPLVVLSVCVSPAGPPLCLRLVQVKPQPLYHCALHP